MTSARGGGTRNCSTTKFWLVLDNKEVVDEGRGEVIRGGGGWENDAKNAK